MIAHCRRQHPSRVPMLTVLIGSLWLAGCASSNNHTAQTNPAAADAYTQLGVAYLERDNLPRALNALDRALEIAHAMPKHCRHWPWFTSVRAKATLPTTIFNRR